MLYGALGNKPPNISESRFECSSSSFKLDSLGNPSVSFLEIKQGHNNINYVFWDGLQWSYNDIPLVYSSQEDIVYSPNSFILGEGPVIAFSRESPSGSKLFLTTYDNEWVFNTLDVNYEVSWIGVVGKGDLGPSSSSSSLSSSSAYSSSSSISSYEYYVVVYDSTNSLFKVYRVSSSWTLLGIMSYSLTSFDSIRIDSCGHKIGIAFVHDDIKYNFFDIDSATWSFVTFDTVPSSILYGPVIDMDFKGYFYGSDSVMAFGWLSGDGSYSYICSVLMNDLGIETYPDGISAIVESAYIDVVASSGYIVNGFRTIGVSLDSSLYIHMFASGLKNKLFDLGFSGWAGTNIEINGISEGIAMRRLRCEFYNTAKIVGIDAGNVYYFNYIAGSSFVMSTPDITLINSQNPAGRVIYSSGILSPSAIIGTLNDAVGDILRDNERPVLIISNK
jgi:hypothetical protein